MAEVTIRVDRARLRELSLDTLIELEEGTLSARAMRELLATFMVDDDDNYLPREEALRIIGQTRMSDVADVLTEFAAQLRAAALPPAAGGGS